MYINYYYRLNKEYIKKGQDEILEKFQIIIASLEELNIFSIILRVGLAIICGGILGIERGKANQAAGMRTHILVCLGATLIMLTGQYMFYEFKTGDPTRLGAQVVSGIGFLGAGSIIVEGRTKVRGLTTAAGLWTTACIGLAIGIGFYGGGLIVTIAVYIVISKFRTISDHFTHNNMWLRIYIEFQSMASLEEIYGTLIALGMQMGDVVLNNPNNTNNYNAIICLKNINDKSSDQIREYLGHIKNIDTIKFIN